MEKPGGGIRVVGRSNFRGAKFRGDRWLFRGVLGVLKFEGNRANLGQFGAFWGFFWGGGGSFGVAASNLGAAPKIGGGFGGGGGGISGRIAAILGLFGGN